MGRDSPNWETTLCQIWLNDAVHMFSHITVCTQQQTQWGKFVRENVGSLGKHSVSCSGNPSGVLSNFKQDLEKKKEIFRYNYGCCTIPSTAGPCELTEKKTEKSEIGKELIVFRFKVFEHIQTDSHTLSELISMRCIAPNAP